MSGGAFLPNRDYTADLMLSELYTENITSTENLTISFSSSNVGITVAPTSTTVAFNEALNTILTEVVSIDVAIEVNKNYTITVSLNSEVLEETFRFNLSLFVHNFYRHNNGITIICIGVEEGGTETIGGVLYTKRTASEITEANAETTCTSDITNMSNLFPSASSFNENIGSWDVSSVTDMSSMFSGATVFNQNISSWDVSSVMNMNSMFSGATSFNQDISGWCVSQISTEPVDFAESIFEASNHPSWGNCPPFYLHTNGVTITCTDAENGDTAVIGGVLYTKRPADQTKRPADQITSDNAETTCTSGITDMSNLFEDATSFNADISSWDVSSVTDMNSMFSGATAFNQDIGSWAVSSVMNMSNLFEDATAFNQDIGSWAVSSVMNMSNLFEDATAFNQDIGSWDTAMVTNMNSMFFSADAFNQDIGSWNVSKVTDMGFMFSNADAFNQDLNSWCVSQIDTEPTDFAETTFLSANRPIWGVCPINGFYLHSNGITIICTSAGEGDTATINGVEYTKRTKSQITTSNAVTSCTSGITDMREMFKDATSFNGDISSWDVSSVTDMSSMFSGATAFNQDIGDWDVSSVTRMDFMFANTDVFNQDIGDWNVSSVVMMNTMFGNARSFNQDIGDWDTSSVLGVLSISEMFLGATAFNQDLTRWCVTNIVSEPVTFAETTFLAANRPKWGTCP